MIQYPSIEQTVKKIDGLLSKVIFHKIKSGLKYSGFNLCQVGYKTLIIVLASALRQDFSGLKKYLIAMPNCSNIQLVFA